jgi:protein TonB
MHVAAGVALFFWPVPGMDRDENVTRQRGAALVIEMIPLDREGAVPEDKAGKTGSMPMPVDMPLRMARDRARPQRAAEGRAAGSNGQNQEAIQSSPQTAPAATDIPTAELLAYRARLQEHLDRYRVYPAAARSGGKEGVVQVRFLIDHEGRIIDAWIESSSGVAEIDREALASVARAQPMPPPPSAWPDKLDISLPITFQIR